MKAKKVAIVVYGDMDSTRNALLEDNFKPLAEALSEVGFAPSSVLYHDDRAKLLVNDLQQYAAVLVWVDPIVQGRDRRVLDQLLADVSDRDIFVSTHPEIIQKIGTKRVLYTSRQMSWGGDTEMYTDHTDFEQRFIPSLGNSSIRVLKQYRGSSGNGVFKVYLDEADRQRVCVIHAPAANEIRRLSKEDFHAEFRGFFENGGLLVNQRWAGGITNGMVRCYISGTKVAGFGYQEAIAMCPATDDPKGKVRPTSRRFYFSEDCGLFQDLRKVMETTWIPQLQDIHAIDSSMLPLLWDVDLFINDVNCNQAEQKYTLCEINVSCVSPFPPSCARYIAAELKQKLL